jgi:type IV pilus assembly protein PilA
MFIEVTKSKKAFTLIEVLIVLTIITILAAIIIIAVNPARQFAQARNTQRWSGVNAILNAIQQNAADNAGNFNFDDCGASSFPSSATNVGDNSPAVGDLDLCDCLVPTYVAEMPVDPTDGSYTDCADYNTAYSVHEDATTGRIVVSAPSADLSESISVTR